MNFTKVNGVWRETDSLSTRVGGVWREGESVHTRVGGVWREAWENGFYILDHEKGGMNPENRLGSVSSYGNTWSVLPSNIYDGVFNWSLSADYDSYSWSLTTEFPLDMTNYNTLEMTVDVDLWGGKYDDGSYAGEYAEFEVMLQDEHTPNPFPTDILIKSWEVDGSEPNYHETTGGIVTVQFDVSNVTGLYYLYLYFSLASKESDDSTDGAQGDVSIYNITFK